MDKWAKDLIHIKIVKIGNEVLSVAWYYICIICNGNQRTSLLIREKNVFKSPFFFLLYANWEDFNYSESV